jgi:hypothetical protein
MEYTLSYTLVNSQLIARPPLLMLNGNLLTLNGNLLVF